MVPLILAWVDTIRLALADEREFQEKFVRHPLKRRQHDFLGAKITFTVALKIPDSGAPR
jgi:hypothetical protein